MTRVQANLLLLLAGCIWGMGFVAQSTAMAGIGPLLFIGVRSVVASLTVLPMAVAEARRAKKPVTPAQRLKILGVGLSFFIGMALQQFGLVTTSVTNAGFLTGLYVVIVPVLGVALFRTWPHPVVWPCAAACLAGIFLLSGGQLSALKQGDWLVIAGALFWALQVILVGKARDAGRPMLISFTQVALSAAVGLAAAFALEDVRWSALALAWKEILFTGAFSCGIGFTLQTVAQRYTTSAQAAIFLSSEALFAALFGAIFLGERLPPIGFVGCGLLFAAMLAVEILPMLWRAEDGDAPLAEAAE